MESKTLTKIQIRKAKPDDCFEIALLVKMAGLAIDDIDPELQGFMVAHDAEQVVGTVGIEAFGKIGLLRSLVVAKTHRNQAIGHQLYKQAIDYAQAQGIEELYLLTTTADAYFAKRGFARIERTDVPDEIKSTEQFSSICPSTAIIMRRSL